MKALACTGMGRAEKGMFNGFRSSGLGLDEMRVEELTEKKIEEGEYLFVFTANFSPAVSAMCQNVLVPYFSYIMEWPVPDLYNQTVKNPCNFIFCFDRAVFRKVNRMIPERSYYLPLGADVQELPEPETKESDRMDVSFTGRLYTEEKAYDRAEGLTEYVKGYLEALLKVQVRIYGYNLLEEGLTEEVMKDWRRCVPDEKETDLSPGADRSLLAATCLADKVTEIERNQMLDAVSRRFEMHVYTDDGGEGLPDVHLHRLEGADREEICRNSRINLHFTHRAVTSGVPQELYDMMAAGGFVLTNFQPELTELFAIGEHLDTFSSEEELLEKIAYYLEHEEERSRIAKAGQQAVRDYHSYQSRAVTMFNTVFADGEAC